MENVKEMGLLDILAAKAGCMYLSDLAQPYMRQYIIHPLRRIDASAFSLWEWNDAVKYLTGKSCSFESGEQARRYLLNFFRNCDSRKKTFPYC